MIEYILFFWCNIAGTSKQFSQRNIRRFSFIIYLIKLHPSLNFRAFGIKITEETFILVKENKQYAFSFWKVQKTISRWAQLKQKFKTFTMGNQYSETSISRGSTCAPRGHSTGDQYPNPFEKKHFHHDFALNLRPTIDYFKKVNWHVVNTGFNQFLPHRLKRLRSNGDKIP